MKRTTTEKELREWSAKGKPWADLAKQLSVPVSYIEVAARIFGIESAVKKKRRICIESRCTEAAARLAAGESGTSIANSMGIPFITLYQSLKRGGYPTSRVEAMKRAMEKKA